MIPFLVGFVLGAIATVTALVVWFAWMWWRVEQDGRPITGKQ